MSLNDERPEDEVTDEKILSSILTHRLKLSLEAVARAQALAWYDLPMNEKRRYVQAAEAALKEELKTS